MILIFLFLAAGLIMVRSSPLFRTLFGPRLNSVGLQVGDYIHTPVSLIHHPMESWFDLVLIGHQQNRLHGYRILHQDYFEIYLHHVPVGHKLIYLHQGQQQDIPYLTGTPFSLAEGELILYRKRRRGLGFVHEEVARGTRWPF